LPNPILLKSFLPHWERQRQFNQFDGEEVIIDLSNLLLFPTAKACAEQLG
jgi:hypothetical protein